MKILVTGGAGFIGSAVVRRLMTDHHCEVVNLDKLTYAANLESLDSISGNPAYQFEKVDICDRSGVRNVLDTHQPDVIMHLAAESHVDRSIDGPADFIETNIIGTYRLLEVALAYYKAMTPERQSRFRFHHISTDEVYGALGMTDPAFNPDTAYDPRSPYSASKAASDHLVMAWHHTYGLPVVLSNCSNNYGPYQFPEKLIPLMIINALSGRPLPVYGKGENVRDWLHVDDHAEALIAILKSGRVGQSYLVGGAAERSNIDVVRSICRILDEVVPDSPHKPHADLISYVDDRPGHDLRYSVDFQKTSDELGWSPSLDFDQGLRQTVSWYLQNRDWWEPLARERYDGERLGLKKQHKEAE